MKVGYISIFMSKVQLYVLVIKYLYVRNYYFCVVVWNLYV